MIAVDSSALIAILRRAPEADSFLQVIATAEGCLSVTPQVVAQDAGPAEAAR